MKFYKITALIVTLLVLGTFTVQAQWDDVYYDPDKDVIVERTNRYSSNDNDYRNSQSFNDESGYYNDYDFFYTSRIRRFHRPMYGFGFFDPVYIDAGYYDPFMRSGMTALIYDDFYSRRMMSRSGFGFGFGYSPWRSYSSFGYDPFYSPFGYGNRFSVGFGSSPFGYYSAFNGLYCPPSWGNSYSYNNVNNYYSDTNSRGTTYAPRRGGSSITPNPDVIQRRGTINNGRTTNPGTVDGRRPYPYSQAGTNSLKPTTRKPQYNTDNSRDRSRTRSTTAQPYSKPRNNSTINSNSNRTRTRAITPSSRTRTRTINNGSSRTRSVTPSSRTRINNSGSSSRSRISTPSRSNTVKSSGSSSSRTRSSSSGSSRKRGND